MPRTLTPRQVVEAYLFWKWEYDRRNDKYIKRYDELIASARIIIEDSQFRDTIASETKRQGKIPLGDIIEKGEPLDSPDYANVSERLKPWSPWYIYKIKEIQEDIEGFHETFGRYPKDPKWGFSVKDIVDFLAINKKSPSEYPAEDIHYRRMILSNTDNRKILMSERSFFEIYGKHPKAPKPGCSREEIVEFQRKYILKFSFDKFIDKDILAKVVTGARASGFFSEYLDEYLSRAGVSVKRVRWDEGRKKLLLEIDVTAPLNAVLEGVSTYYLSYNVDVENGPADFLPLIQHMYGVIRNFLDEKDLRKFRTWEPRAAGLLLWEYMEENKGISVEDAVNVPELSKGLENLGYGQQISLARAAKFAKPGYVAEQKKEDYYRQFRRYRQKTHECITQHKVLPIK